MCATCIQPAERSGAFDTLSYSSSAPCFVRNYYYSYTTYECVCVSAHTLECGTIIENDVCEAGGGAITDQRFCYSQPKHIIASSETRDFAVAAATSISLRVCVLGAYSFCLFFFFFCSSVRLF